MPIVSCNDIDIAYELAGDGPETVVLIIGLADQKEGWGLQVPALVEAGYQVLTLDNRGIGDTSKPDGPYTPRQMAKDVKALVETLGIRDVHMVGFSMGGMIAQEFALAYPDCLRSLVLASTYSEPGPFCDRLFNSWRTLTSASGWEVAVTNVLLWCFSPTFYEDQPDFAKEVDDGICEIKLSNESFLAQLDAITNFDVTDRVSGISTPTMVLANEEDILIPPVLSKRLCDQIAGSKWHMCRGGHASLCEYPYEFNNTLIEFFDHQGE